MTLWEGESHTPKAIPTTRINTPLHHIFEVHYIQFGFSSVSFPIAKAEDRNNTAYATTTPHLCVQENAQPNLGLHITQKPPFSEMQYFRNRK